MGGTNSVKPITLVIFSPGDIEENEKVDGKKVVSEINTLVSKVLPKTNPGQKPTGSTRDERRGYVKLTFNTKEDRHEFVTKFQKCTSEKEQAEYILAYDLEPPQSK